MNNPSDVLLEFFEQHPEWTTTKPPADSQLAPPAHSEWMAVDDQSDDANALRFVEEHGEVLRYRQDTRHWMMWSSDQGVWRPRQGDELIPLARQTARRAEQTASQYAATLDAKSAAPLRRQAREGRNRHRLRAAIAIATTDAAVTTLAADWNRDPWLLNCRNGTLDLRNGVLLPHRAEQLIDHQVPVEYDPNATCPTWDRFLREVLVSDNGEADEDLISFVQRSVGYSLTGLTTDHVLWLLIGDGANGKWRSPGLTDSWGVGDHAAFAVS